jgi:hypothetical protein
MNEREEIELVENVKSITDRLNIVDEILKAARLGRNMVMAFVCGESGLLYPADYVKNWGKLYGIGLGPSPVSESLQSEYDVAPPALTSEIQTLEQIMHPLRSSCAQMDTALVDAASFASQSAVLVLGDEKMRKRAPILYAKQINNPRGRLGVTRAAWANLGRNA